MRWRGRGCVCISRPFEAEDYSRGCLDVRSGGQTAARHLTLEVLLRARGSFEASAIFRQP
jgi:hypothetical protein